MPIECDILRHQLTHSFCPKCGHVRFEPFMRGQVQSRWRRILGLPYYAVICSNCKKIVGHEKPDLWQLADQISTTERDHRRIDDLRLKHEHTIDLLEKEIEELQSRQPASMTLERAQEINRDCVNLGLHTEGLADAPTEFPWSLDELIEARRVMQQHKKNLLGQPGSAKLPVLCSERLLAAMYVWANSPATPGPDHDSIVAGNGKALLLVTYDQEKSKEKTASAEI